MCIGSNPGNNSSNSKHHTDPATDPASSGHGGWVKAKLGVRGSTSVKDFTRKSYGLTYKPANKTSFLGEPPASLGRAGPGLLLTVGLDELVKGWNDEPVSAQWSPAESGQVVHAGTCTGVC
jgi:hypothetical protein